MLPKIRTTKTITFKSKKIKTFGYLILSSLFVFTAIFFLKEKPFIGWLSIVFFGIASLVFLIHLLPNSNYLKIHQNQIEIRTLYKSNFVNKKDIADFGIAKISIIHVGNQFLNYDKQAVGYNFTESSSKNNALGKINKNISYYQAALPDNYGYKPDELVKILNDWLK